MSSVHQEIQELQSKLVARFHGPPVSVCKVLGCVCDVIMLSCIRNETVRIYDVERMLPVHRTIHASCKYVNFSVKLELVVGCCSSRVCVCVCSCISTSLYNAVRFSVTVRAFNLCQYVGLLLCTGISIRESVHVCEHLFMHHASCIIFANRGRLFPFLDGC